MMNNAFRIRLDRLEKQISLTEEDCAILDFLDNEDPKDADFYRDIISRPGAENFKQYLGTLSDDELERAGKIMIRYCRSSNNINEQLMKEIASIEKLLYP